MLRSACLLALALGLVAGEADPRAELRALAAETGRLSRAFSLVQQVVAASVVSVHTKVQQYRAVVNPWGEVLALRPGRQVEVGEGSGFVVRSDATGSWIATNAHVAVQRSDDDDYLTDRKGQPRWFDRLVIELSDGRLIEASPVGVSTETDIAVVKIAVPNLPAVEWADSDAAHVGDWVVALGYPLGVGLSLTSGVISATDRAMGGGGTGYLQTDAAINPGNSGGPLADLLGRILGINTSIRSTTGANIGLGFAIPARLAQRVIADLIAHGQVRWAAIGLTVDDLSAEQATTLDLPPRPQVLVTRVQPGSPAATAGLRRRDVLLAVDGIPVRQQVQYRGRLAAAAIGATMTLTVSREGKELHLSVVTVGHDALPATPADPARTGRLAAFELTVAEDGSPGLVVVDAHPTGPAGRAGLDPGDRILAIRGLGEVTRLQDLAPLAERRDAVLQVVKDGVNRWVRMVR